MSSARLPRASQPVSPTTAAMAPKAPIGATHMIMASTLKTTRWKMPMPRSADWPVAPRPWIAKPTSSATNSVDSTDSPTSGETSVVGMSSSRKSTVPLARLAGLVRGGGRQALARLDEVADDQADGQGERRHRHEVAEREPADPADLGGLADRADAQHDRAEDHRRDHHLDEVDEAGAERLERTCRARGRSRRRGRPPRRRRSRRCRGSACGPGAGPARCWRCRSSSSGLLGLPPPCPAGGARPPGRAPDGARDHPCCAVRHV